eukprot:2096700-Prymnesium_polylepis.1
MQLDGVDGLRRDRLGACRSGRATLRLAVRATPRLVVAAQPESPPRRESKRDCLESSGAGNAEGDTLDDAPAALGLVLAQRPTRFGKKDIAPDAAALAPAIAPAPAIFAPDTALAVALAILAPDAAALALAIMASSDGAGNRVGGGCFLKPSLPTPGLRPSLSHRLRPLGLQIPPRRISRRDNVASWGAGSAAGAAIVPIFAPRCHMNPSTREKREDLLLSPSGEACLDVSSAKDASSDAASVAAPSGEKGG